MLMEKGVEPSQIPILARADASADIPLSYSQQRLWFLDRLEPDNPLYNISIPVHIKGRLNVVAMERSLQWIMDRHRVLKTRFAEKDGNPVQIIDEKMTLQLETKDISGMDETLVQDMINEEARRTFNLSKGPLLRATLLKKATDENIAILTMHHIVSDNWSTGLLIREFMRAYPAYAAGRTPQADPLPVQYADFAAWQRKWISGKTLDKQLAYWQEQLADCEGLLEMPWDYPRPSFQTYNGSALTFALEKDKVDALKALADKHDVTLFMVLAALYNVFLHKYSAADRIAVGTPIANRNRRETEELIGFFINTLVLHTDLAGDPTFAEIMKRTKEVTIGAYDHQDVPFENVVEKIDPPRDTGYTALFQNMLVLNNAPIDKLTLEGLELQVLEPDNHTSKFDLIFNFTEDEGRLKVKIEYNTDLYHRDTIEKMRLHFEMITGQVLANDSIALSEISLLSEDEKKRLLSDWAVSARTIDSEKLLPQIILETADRNAGRKAIKTGHLTLSYGELQKQVQSVASYLADRAVGRGRVVAVLAGRTPQLVSAMLGIMHYGATYLPLDPAYPDERLRFMLEDSNAVLVLGDERYSEKARALSQVPFTAFDEIPEKAFTGEPLTGDLPAYMIYTSGTSGQPKGVIVTHKTIADHVLDMADHFGINENDTILQFAALNFDASLEQIFPGLCVGATVFLRDEDVWPVDSFLGKIEQYGLTVVNPPTAYWQQWVQHLEQNENLNRPRHLRLVIAGGDVMKKDVLSKWHGSPLSPVRLLNAYGPTEACITATTFEADANLDMAGSRVPIGRPCAKRNVYVLDRYGKPVPAGFPGELCIGGEILATGYHNRPALTAERFTVDPFLPVEKARMYKTGDRVRFNSKGELEFLGRVDEQVKIRGFRIEPGEVEQVLRKHDAVQDAIVLPAGHAGEKALFAWYITKHDDLQVNELRGFLQKRLPDYMIPVAFVRVDNFPQTPAGKIDKRALPFPEDMRTQLSSEYIAPRTDSEKKLAAIVGSMLKLEKVGIHDNFFELGGHSMMGTRVISEISSEFGVELPLRVLFEKPTVEGIAGAIMEAQAMLTDEDELDEMLSSLEGLDEEEINKLLNDDKEQNG